MNCLLDMDGVLVDFVGGAMLLMDKLDYIDLSDYGENSQFYYSVNYEKVYADNLGNPELNKILGVSPENFYEHMDEDYWYNLSWMYDGQDILRLCEATFGRDNIYICTAPITTPGCCDGKRRWVRKNLGEDYLKRMIVTSQKHIMDKSAILIDDADKNIKKFPGKGILVNRIWNSGYNDRGRSLEVLQAELQKICQAEKPHIPIPWVI